MEMNLPEGYQLDSPSNTVQGNVPAGYKLDNTESPAFDPMAVEKESGNTYPNARMTDVSIPDAMAVQGIGGLAKTGAGLAARGVGAALDAMPLTENLTQTVGDTADDMLLKGIGTSAGQVKQVDGIEAARDAAQVGRRAGLDDIFTTDIGRKAALQNTLSTEGKQIGDLRAAAGKPSPSMLDQVGASLKAKYNPVNPDVLSSQAPQVDLSLNRIKNVAGSDPTHASIAEGITDLNNYATGEKVRQPVNAMTDVANKASAANNAEIAQSLGSDKAASYLDALHNETGAFHLKPMLERGFNREAVSRGGGKNILQSLIQKVADNGGYRAASKGLDAVHGALTETPDLSTLGPNALKAYLAQKADEENQ